MYVLGTSAAVALVPNDKIDLVSPISQALTLGTRPGDPGASLIPLVIAALLFSFIAQQALTFAVTTRLPLVAGWDKLLPDWFGRLHPRLKTPTNSILFVGAVALSMAIAGVAGAGRQEAFQLLQERSRNLLRAGISGYVRAASRRPTKGNPQTGTVAARRSRFRFCNDCDVSRPVIVPIIDVPKPLIFTVKVGAFILAWQLAAAAIFYSYRRRSRVIPE